MSVPKLKITEIFYSLQGETSLAGLPTVFIRLTGCPLRCHYCDTEYAFHGGEWMSMEAVLEKVNGFQAAYVTVTGGEPMAQKSTRQLLSALCDQGYRVSLETSGAISLAGVDARVVKIMDIKTPASGESHRHLVENHDYLQAHDEIKFVICGRDDYEWARERLREWDLAAKVHVLFSPVSGAMPPADLALWILQDRLPVRMQLQLHKIIWGDERGR